LDIQDELKKRAAIRAVDFIESEMVLGLGTGSTANFASELNGLVKKFNPEICKTLSESQAQSGPHFWLANLTFP